MKSPFPCFPVAVSFPSLPALGGRSKLIDNARKRRITQIISLLLTYKSPNNEQMFDETFAGQAPQSKFNLHHDMILASLDRMSGEVLHAAQVQALKGLHSHFMSPSINSENIGVAVLPTGAGKSGVAVLAPYVLNSSSVLIITPSVLISSQLYREMCGDDAHESFFVKRGIVTADNFHKIAEHGLLVDKPLVKNRTMEDVVQNLRKYRLVIANAHKFGEPAGFVDLGKFPKDLFDTIIVDEAHHYPAKTWKRIIDHFKTSKKVFLTATPFHRGQQIVGTSIEDQRNRYIAFQLTRDDAVDAHIIRKLEFQQYGQESDQEPQRIAVVVGKMVEMLHIHDQMDGMVHHKGMILCFLVVEADQIVRFINETYGSADQPLAVAYHGSSGKDGFDLFCASNATNRGPRIIVSCRKALEGFDHPAISVVGILRNIAQASMVLFSQFVGRCVRNAHPGDNVTAVVISHVMHKQFPNYQKLDVLAEDGVDPQDEEEPEDGVDSMGEDEG